MILVSSCLLGECTKYSGGHNLHPFFETKKEGIISVCPEVMGGLLTPRPPAEIVGGSGADVISGRCSVCSKVGTDVTAEFLCGAKKALALANEHHVEYAVLKESSPSCGSHTIYDGTFSGVKRAGEGVTTSLLRAHGITVYSEKEITEGLWQKMVGASCEKA